MPADAPWAGERIEALLTLLSGTFDHLRRLAELPAAQAIEFVVTEDLAADVRSHVGRVVGVEDLSDYGVERVGGTVVGKTFFRDDAHRDIVIILAAEIFQAAGPQAEALAVNLASHELAHGLVGQMRSANGTPMAPSYMPWEIAPWLARYAFEEYLVDMIAEVVLRQFGHVTDADGSERPLSMQHVWPRSLEFTESACRAVERIVDRIHTYRLDGDLEPMWQDVYSTTSQVLITLAHAQAELDAPSADVPGEDATATLGDDLGPFHECWAEMHRLFAAFPLIATPERFAELEPELLRGCGALIMELWAKIGLTFRPEGDAFHITVAGPFDAWPLAS